ncbi:MAG TPA: ABC transporter substrate-binding protein [Thermomicrobiales bacterium]|nr:ABC transporter substrate-binding protein [Thermomicrobiales bacterium]
MIGGALGLAGMAALAGGLPAGGRQAKRDSRGPYGRPIVSLARLPGIDVGADARSESAWLSTLLYDSPLSIGVDGQLRGGVAIGWDVDDDGLLIELEIRRDALFPGGLTVTPVDVLASIERARHRPADSVDSWRWDRIERVEAVEGQRVRIHLREPDVTVLWSLASTRVPVVPATWADRDWDAGTGRIPPGSGAFQLSGVNGDEVILDRHAGFWQVGRPRLEGLTIRGSSPTLARATEFVASDIDVLIGVPLLDVPMLRVDPGVTLSGGPGNQLCLLSVNTRRPELREREIRQLVAGGIDRPALANAATASEATPTSRLLPENHWAAPDGELERLSTDEVRAALVERGFFGGLPLRLITTAADASLANACVLLQEQLAYAGIALTLDLLDDAELTRALERGDWDLHALYSPAWHDPHELVRPLLHSRGSLNHGGYASARMDTLLDRASGLAAVRQRGDAYRQAQDLALADVPIIPLFIPDYYDAVSKSIRNYEAYPPVSAHGLRQAWIEPPADEGTP